MTRLHFPISLPGLQVTQVHQRDDVIEIYASSVQSKAICPDCHRPSRHVHSDYARAPTDFPASACCVRLPLTVKRFRCQTEACSRRTFVECFPNLLAKYAHRTERLQTAHEALAFALGGAAGSRLAQKLQMPIRGNTLLRSIRKTEEDVPAEPEVLEVDDWAKRRGKVYGTILVDLERRQVIDLLTDRTADTLATWLRTHPSVKIVARDRAGEYARGITMGAPQAAQVADRWHLLVNLREAFERLLDRLRPEFQGLVPLETSAKPAEIPVRRRRHRSQSSETARQTHRQKRHALYTKIQRLREQGASIRAIARQVHKSPTTIYKYLAMPEFPQKLACKRMTRMLDLYEAYLTQRWQEGCRNALQLWREIQDRGYPGTSRQVSKWAYERREKPATTTPSKHLEANAQGQPALRAIRTPLGKQTLPVAQRLVWLFLHPLEKLEAEEQDLRDHLTDHSELKRGLDLVQAFQRMVRERAAHEFEAWLQACETSQLTELINLAHGMRKDFSAIQNALDAPWSNGQTEGQINRLKFLKRQMYGRAKFDLLRLRFLHPP